MPIRIERLYGCDWYQNCAICDGIMLTRDPQPALYTADRVRVGWVCADCLRLAPDTVRGRMQDTADRHRRQASALEALAEGSAKQIWGSGWAKAVAALPEPEIDPVREAYEADRS